MREIALRGTMSSAAASLQLSTSAVSQQIARLEAEAGSELLHRRGRHVEFTQAGRLLVTRAAEILSGVEQAESELAALRQEPRGTVRVATFSSAGRVLVPAVIRGITRRHDELLITVRDYEPRETITGLNSGQLDIGIVDGLDLLSNLIDPALKFSPLGKDRLVAVLPVGHRLEGAAEVDLTDLADDPWLLDDESTSYCEMIIRAAQSAGVIPTVNAHCRDALVTVALVEAGCGISILPNLWVSTIRRGVVVKTLTPPIERSIVLAYRKGAEKHPNISAVLDEFRKMAIDLNIV